MQDFIGQVKLRGGRRACRSDMWSVVNDISLLFGVCVEDGDGSAMGVTPLDTEEVAVAWAVVTEVRIVSSFRCLVRMGGCGLAVEMKCHFI